MGLVKKARRAKCTEGKMQYYKQGWPSLLEKAILKLIGRLAAGRNGKDQLRSYHRKGS